MLQLHPALDFGTDELNFYAFNHGLLKIKGGILSRNVLVTNLFYWMHTIVE
jgi:hypothetical protein